MSFCLFGKLLSLFALSALGFLVLFLSGFLSYANEVVSILLDSG